MDRSTQARLASDVEYLFAAVEPNWVEQHVAELREFQVAWQRSGGRQQGSRSFHPLAVSATGYLVAPNAEDAYNSMGDNFFRLAMTGEAVRLLDGMPGLDARVKNLTRGDDALYYATEFELHSAALYARTGHSVAFVAETDTPSFDLLIDDAVEVECKQATPVTQPQRHATDLWSLLDRRLRTLLDQHDSVFFVHATVPGLPNRHQVDEILGEIKQFVDDGTSSAAKTHGDIQYRYARTQPRVVGGGMAGRVPHWFPDQADHSKMELSMALGDSADAGIGRGCALALDSRTPPPDPAEVIQKQLRKTLRQFTGDRPAVVHADITSALRRSRLSLSETAVGHRVRSWLQRHAEITAVNVLSPPPEAATALLTFHLERNPKPTRELPTPFLGVDWTNLPQSEANEI